ncbi:hypothetical protein DESC_820003 [Desulfosarcina cetonica]|nr:hypothetical protein DESC_820003 [Desulfosarcina cetonica]
MMAQHHPKRRQQKEPEDRPSDDFRAASGQGRNEGIDQKGQAGDASIEKPLENEIQGHEHAAAKEQSDEAARHHPVVKNGKGARDQRRQDGQVFHAASVDRRPLLKIDRPGLLDIDQPIGIDNGGEDAEVESHPHGNNENPREGAFENPVQWIRFPPL